MNLGINVPEDYVQAGAQLATTLASNGDQTTARNDLMTVNYNASGLTNRISSNLLGSIWGLGYKGDTNTLYAAAFLKRHVGFVPTTGTIDSIYAIDSNTYAILAQIQLSTLGINVGANPRVSALSSSPGSPNHDPEVFTWIGKRGIGDIDVSADNQRLYVVNLNSAAPSLVVLNLANPTAPTPAQNVAISNPGCSNGEFAPFGLKEYRGQVYVGVVCTAETSGLTSDLKAYVLRWTGGTSWSVVPGFPLALDYDRGCAYGQGTTTSLTSCAPGEWQSWTGLFSDFVASSGNTTFKLPQPLLSNIEFDDAGNMIIVLRDRSGDQIGASNYSTVLTDTTTYGLYAVGDVLRMCASNGSFIREGNAGCPTTRSEVIEREKLTPPLENNGIPTEFYDDYINYFGTNATNVNGHAEGSTGGLTLWPGSNHLVVTHYAQANVAHTGGLRWWSNVNGSTRRSLGMYTNLRPDTFGKANRFYRK